MFHKNLESSDIIEEELSNDPQVLRDKGIH